MGVFLVYGFKVLFSILFDRYSNGLFAGTLFGYICYDMTHYFIHHQTPVFEFYKRLKQYHILHHYKNPHRGYGVSNKMWDYVFNTVLKENTIKKN